MQGAIMQIQPFSVNDGDGIRTTIFLAGCPLHCKWCANPEGLNAKPKTAFYEKLCIGCGLCAQVCPQKIGIDLHTLQARTKCTGCGSCADICPKHAKKRMIEYKTVEQVIQEIKKHSLFLRQSGGGITFSGGEATMQHEFLDVLSERLYDMGFHLALETCGYFDFDTIKPILERMDFIFMDLKHMDTIQHKYYTGIGNETILKNMIRLQEIQADIVIRIPVIEGVNADIAQIAESAKFVHQHLPKAKMELLPYHRFGFGKYEALDLPMPSNDFAAPSEEKMAQLKQIIIEQGIVLADFR